MYENKEKPIKGLEIKYKGNTYNKIIYFSINNYDGENKVSFTNKDSKDTMTNVNCLFEDIEIIKKGK